MSRSSIDKLIKKLEAYQAYINLSKKDTNRLIAEFMGCVK